MAGKEKCLFSGGCQALLIQTGIHSDKRSKERRAIAPHSGGACACRHRVSFDLGGLLKIITTTKVNNETLVSFSNWSGIPRRHGNNTTHSASSGSQLFDLRGRFSLVGPSKHLSETAMIK